MKASDIQQLLTKTGIQALTVQEGIEKLVMRLKSVENEAAMLRGEKCGDSDYCGGCLKCLQHDINALTVDRDAWKNAILDAAVVDWVYQAEHENNPRQVVNDLLCWQQKIALDPTISKEAAEWQRAVEKSAVLLNRLTPYAGETGQPEQPLDVLDRLTKELDYSRSELAKGTPFRHLVAAFRQFCISLLPRNG
jgi:hypothetical protein